jgi:hypothetical protein
MDSIAFLPRSISTPLAPVASAQGAERNFHELEFSFAQALVIPFLIGIAFLLLPKKLTYGFGLHHGHLQDSLSPVRGEMKNPRGRGLPMVMPGRPFSSWKENPGYPVRKHGEERVTLFFNSGMIY